MVCVAAKRARALTSPRSLLALLAYGEGLAAMDRGDYAAAERYGRDHVAQIVTFSTIKARAAVRDAVARGTLGAARLDSYRKLIAEEKRREARTCRNR